MGGRPRETPNWQTDRQKDSDFDGEFDGLSVYGGPKWIRG